MKDLVFKRNQQLQASVQTRARLRVPSMLSVAVVSGMLATGSCGGGDTTAKDASPRDGQVQMADAQQPAKLDAAAGKDASVDAVACGAAFMPCCPGHVCQPPGIC